MLSGTCSLDRTWPCVTGEFHLSPLHMVSDCLKEWICSEAWLQGDQLLQLQPYHPPRFPTSIQSNRQWHYPSVSCQSARGGLGLVPSGCKSHSCVLLTHCMTVAAVWCQCADKQVQFQHTSWHFWSCDADGWPRHHTCWPHDTGC